MHVSDYELLSRSLQDIIVEPHRKALIPKFDELKDGALKSGALGCAISGSGPSIFTLNKGLEIAKKVKNTFDNIYNSTAIKYDIHISKINTEGIKIL